MKTDLGPAGETAEYFQQQIVDALGSFGKTAGNAGPSDWYSAVSVIVRAKLLPVWEATKAAYAAPEVKQAYYLSIEWLLGPNIHTALTAAGVENSLRLALESFGQDPDAILNFEMDPGLGNGGLGRLAACFIDSGANLHLPLQGYGLLYSSGFFRQQISPDGSQIELPDNWCEDGIPWSVARTEFNYYVTLFRDYRVTLAVHPHDMMVPSYDGRTVNTLRLWEIQPPDSLYTDFASSAHSDQQSEMRDIIRDINQRLYPSDEHEKGKNLRLAQEYVLVSASLQDILNRHLHKYPTVRNLADSASIQINDTHPALAIPELMRLLTEVHDLPWEEAKVITRSVCNYTNHTLMGEALEKWHSGKMDYVLPQLTPILNRLHNDLMEEAEQKFAHLSDEERVKAKGRIAIIYSDAYRMGHLAAFYTNRVNGVSAMHTELVYEELFPDLIAMRGQEIKVNHTNGISQRRFLKKANPRLASLITGTLGSEEWITNLDRLRDLEGRIDEVFLDRFEDIKSSNKKRLAALINRECGIDLHAELAAGAMFDIQVKRIHAYKRQLMNVMQTVALYLDIINDPHKGRPAVVKIFAGKAAPSYKLARQTIELINKLANRINSDPRAQGKLKLVFIPDYNVSRAEIIIPAADLSEQISTAGTEASGTSNMKFALNGALTIGTRDGANVEIGEAAGEDNIFFFGMTKEEVDALKSQGYNREFQIAGSEKLLGALQFIEFSLGFSDIADYLRRDDEYMLAADFSDYCEAHERAQALYLGDPGLWRARAVINMIAGSRFSSDRTILGYNAENWNLSVVIPAIPSSDYISYDKKQTDLEKAE